MIGIHQISKQIQFRIPNLPPISIDDFKYLSYYAVLALKYCIKSLV